METTKWRQEQLELYEKLEKSAKNGLNRDAVLASRELFDFDASGRAVPKEFTFEHEDDAVTVVCAEISQAVAQQWGDITVEVLKALEGEAKAADDLFSANLKDVYVSDPDIMHVTLFYTSHPDDLAPRRADEHKSERLSREISLLKVLATQFEPIRIVPVKVVLASSGAILMLFQCVQSEKKLDDNGRIHAVMNAGRNAEFSVDLLRQEARKTFPFVSKKSPSAIIHTTLARILSPDAFDEASLTRVCETCQRISRQMAQDNAFIIDKLWMQQQQLQKATGTPSRNSKIQICTSKRVQDR